MRLSIGLLFAALVFQLACRHQGKSDRDDASQRNAVVDTAWLIAQADSLFMLGQFYDSLNKKDSALYFHQKALSNRQMAKIEDIRLVESFWKVAGYYHHEFRYHVADKLYDNARLAADSLEMRPIDLVNLHIDAANCKVNLKDIPTSLSLLQKALSITDQYLEKKDISYYRINSAMATNYYYLKEYAKSIEYFNKSMNYLQPDDHIRLISIYTSLGMAHRDSDQNKKGLEYFELAIDHVKQLSGPHLDAFAKIYLQKAYAHQNVGEIDSAALYLKLNLAIRKEVFGEKDVNTFGAKHSIGEFYENISEYDSALKYHHESLISLIRNYDNQNVHSQPAPGPAELNTDLILGLRSKASTIVKRCEQDSTKCGDLTLALASYMLADSTFSVFIKNLAYDDPRLRQMESERMPYAAMFELAFRLYHDSGKRMYLEKAFRIIERSRAQLLEATLNQAEAYNDEGFATQFRNEESRLIKERSEVLRQLSIEGISQSESDSLREAFLTLSNQFNRFEKKLEEVNPNYFVIKYGEKPGNIEELQSILKKTNSILLEYLWSEDKIYAMAITKDDVSIRKIVQTEKYRSAFIDFVNELSTDPERAYRPENFQKYCKAAFSLYQELIEGLVPAGEALTYPPNLVISADGPLAAFPFEALLTGLPEGKEVDYRLSYLMNSFPISYTHSSSLFVRQSKKGRNGNKLLALGFAGNGSSRTQRTALSNLPGTEKEVLSIKEVMKNSRNKYFLEEDASESKFKSLVADFNIVHLALHGVADSVNALESKLIFRTEADSLEDGHLYAHELYSLDLKKLDMAVLSACESGIGKQQTGEGVMSIARGFAYAGCPSQIISLWKIDDRTSAKVMANFYRHLSDGEAINVALARAKSDYIRSAREFNSHPGYWAAFLQVGNSKEIVAATVVHESWILYFFLTVIGFVAIHFMIKKSRALMS